MTSKNVGELKKRLNQNCFSCVSETEWDFEAIEKILDEAKKDILPEWYWIKWAHTSQDNDEQLTKDYKNLLLKLEKWFGVAEQ